MKANIKNVQRLLRTAHAHYSQVRPDVEGGMVGIGQHGPSYLRRICFHCATTGCKNEDHERAVEAQVASRLGNLAATFHKIFGEKCNIKFDLFKCIILTVFGGKGSVDLTNAPHCDLQDSTGSFAVWIREQCREHIDEPAWFLLPNYGVALQLCLVAMTWSRAVLRHCSLTGPPPLVSGRW